MCSPEHCPVSAVPLLRHALRKQTNTAATSKTIPWRNMPRGLTTNAMPLLLPDSLSRSTLTLWTLGNAATYKQQQQQQAPCQMSATASAADVMIWSPAQLHCTAPLHKSTCKQRHMVDHAAGWMWLWWLLLLLLQGSTCSAGLRPQHARQPPTTCKQVLHVCLVCVIRQPLHAHNTRSIGAVLLPAACELGATCVSSDCQRGLQHQMHVLALAVLQTSSTASGTPRSQDYKQDRPPSGTPR